MADLPTDLFDYELPPDWIAQEPLAERDASRLLHLEPSGGIADHRFAELPGLLRSGDLVVLNDTTVRAARLRGRRAGGGAAELLVLAPLSGGGHACLVRPARRLPPGTRVELDGGLSAIVGVAIAGHPGARSVTFQTGAGDADGEGRGGCVEVAIEAAIEAAGSVPLPPYIRRPLRDAGRYQTVYAASPPASAAAPTAGLHFTAAVLEGLAAVGVETARVRLDVGLATFSPIRTERIADHRMHEERFDLPDATAAAVDAARRRGGRVIAIGTTSARVLETCASAGGRVAPGSGTTRLYLRPGHPLLVIDGLLTNFHQPRSSLLVLVAALVGTERWREAYAHALASRYRFLSFGDCMLCWRQT